jgi:hypothetical protein
MVVVYVFCCFFGFKCVCKILVCQGNYVYLLLVYDIFVYSREAYFLDCLLVCCGFVSFGFLYLFTFTFTFLFVCTFLGFFYFLEGVVFVGAFVCGCVFFCAYLMGDFPCFPLFLCDFYGFLLLFCFCVWCCVFFFVGFSFFYTST